MKNILFMLSLIVGCSLQAQLSVFGGASSLITLDTKNSLNWGDVSGNGVAKEAYAPNRYIHHFTDNKNSLFFIAPKWGGTIDLGCSYALKHNVFSIEFNYMFQVIGSTGIYYQNESGYKTVKGYESNGSFVLQSISIPLKYGYDIMPKNDKIMLKPYVGWINQFPILSSRFSERIDYFHRWIGSINAGIRLELYSVFIDCSYSRMVTEYNSKYKDVRLQTFKIGFGYVYTFKQKQSKTKVVK